MTWTDPRWAHASICLHQAGYHDLGEFIDEALSTLPTQPEGWRLVPIEPTLEMQKDGELAWMKPGVATFAEIYTAMVKAAPPPPSGEV